jgi:hypothetical protein
MPVTRGKHEVMVTSDGSNPNVVLRERPPFRPKVVLQASILAGNLKIAGKNASALRKLLQLGHVLTRPPGSRGYEEHSPTAMAGTNTSIARSRFDKTASSPSNRAMMVLVSSRSLPLPGIRPLAMLFYC